MLFPEHRPFEAAGNVASRIRRGSHRRKANSKRAASLLGGRADSVGTYGAPKFRTGLRFAGQRKMLTGQMNHENLIELIDEVRLGVGRFAARGGMGRNGFRFGS